MRKIGPIISERIRQKYPNIQDNQENENEVQQPDLRYDFSNLPFRENTPDRPEYRNWLGN